MMKNSEVERTERAAEQAQRADKFKAIMEQQEKEREVNRE